MLAIEQIDEQEKQIVASQPAQMLNAAVVRTLLHGLCP